MYFSFIPVKIVVFTNTQTSLLLSSIHSCFCLDFSRNAKTKKKSSVGDYFLPTTSPVPLKYDSWLFYQKKRTHYISMELKKNIKKM